MSRTIKTLPLETTKFQQFLRNVSVDHNQSQIYNQKLRRFFQT